MEIVFARPSRIIASVAMASLIAGLPLAFILSAYAARRAAAPVNLELFKQLLESAFFGAFFIFLVGMVFIAPMLMVLRKLGAGGPFFVYAASISLAIPFFSNGYTAGIGTTSLALASSYVFSRFAYTDLES